MTFAMPSERELVATGMMDGWAEGYERLERYLRSLRA